ncbi:uncharacterized protein PV09_04143 [Verruconis gallopava]|uniref:Methyltransferase domain-containing protein n=1 Tax=Verruconis gallopava TaxID=253628 RepID=A0A0D1XQR3_9PEZI|nr:uncharacterized protein PV09_04143 [Verruconis gallopava]KIW04981.1 hypothetical protein PV09_04143 [Verruconis gallopava]
MSKGSESSYRPPEDLKARLAASYNDIAIEYNKWTEPHSHIRIPWLKKLFDRLRIPEGEEARILELGAGAGVPTGKAILEFAPTVQYMANDLSARQLQLLQDNLAEHKDRITAMEGDMFALDIPASSLLAVVGMYSIIHLPRDEQSQLLGKIAKWLQPGGYLLANFSEEELEGLVNENWLSEGGWMYWSAWGAERTKKMLEESGLELLESDVVRDVVDANFLWVLARKKEA